MEGGGREKVEECSRAWSTVWRKSSCEHSIVGERRDRQIGYRMTLGLGLEGLQGKTETV